MAATLGFSQLSEFSEGCFRVVTDVVWTLTNAIVIINTMIHIRDSIGT